MTPDLSYLLEGRRKKKSEDNSIDDRMSGGKKNKTPSSSPRYPIQNEAK